MELTWELTDADRELFERELDSFVPDRIYDVHAHLYELWQWKKPTILEGGPEKLPLERYQEEIQWITPGRETHALFFGGGLHEETFRASNEYVAAQVAKDPASRSLLIVSPHMDPEEVRQEVRRLSMVGLKVYQHFAPGEDHLGSGDRGIPGRRARPGGPRRGVGHHAPHGQEPGPGGPDEPSHHPSLLRNLSQDAAGPGALRHRLQSPSHGRRHPLPGGTRQRLVRHLGHDRDGGLRTHCPPVRPRLG